MQRKIILTLIIFLAISFSQLSAQQEKDMTPEYISSIKSALHQLNDLLSRPKNGKTIHHIVYRIRTVMRDPKLPISEDKVELFSGTKRSCLLSKHMQAYYNENNSIVALPDQRLITISRNVSAIHSKIYEGKLLLQDTFLNNYVVEDHDEVYRNTILHKRILLKQKEKNKTYPFPSINFEINSISGDLVSVNIHYRQESEIDSVEILFEQMELNTKTDQLERSAENIFLDKKGKPTGKYKNYRVIHI